MTLSFDFIAIVTADLGASLDFYRALGVDVPTGQDDAPHVEAKLPGGMTLAWDPVSTIRSFMPDFELPEGGNRIGFAFRAESPAEVDRAYADIVERFATAAHTAPWDAPWGQRYATVLDPDGNSIDLYAPLTSDGAAASLG
ncbi:VOC family protein [Leucobacter ruminantium]|uniref:VOC family protein n=1 Tax=Leucobacter ruminantium TaxID=1289170 RepID=A0A939RXJ3_9MICO|nr:VOC family protein [Leucobacter ruminantium]MBO1804743.1 VOC family protein [Leucobacter ruminantium]